MPHFPLKFENHTCWLVIACGFLSFAISQQRVAAECGDYVIIGNKEKRAELKATGYDVGGEMKTHEQPPVDGQPTKNSVPCSGPQCQSNRTPTPEPVPILISLSLSKPGINESTNPYFDRDCQFQGFESHDDQATSYNGSLDRPPE
ncbi:MAG: hypothetical protein VX438_15360 [Planctomycetota bacterium]|nr:hypothetical protein [Planctomycetota bacterium]